MLLRSRLNYLVFVKSQHKIFIETHFPSISDLLIFIKSSFAEVWTFYTTKKTEMESIKSLGFDDIPIDKSNM